MNAQIAQGFLPIDDTDEYEANMEKYIGDIYLDDTKEQILKNPKLWASILMLNLPNHDSVMTYAEEQLKKMQGNNTADAKIQEMQEELEEYKKLYA